MNLHVVDRDNRGDTEQPFGYVYFNDGTRIGYAPGATVRNRFLADNPLGLFSGNWKTEKITTAHFHRAAEYLRNVLDGTNT